MAFKFPWSNLHELNLDWILSIVKTLKESNDEFNEKADYAVETANEAKTIAEQAAQATIPDGSITTAKLATFAVTTDKLGTAAVTTDKIKDGTIQTADLHDDAITSTKLDASLKIKKVNINSNNVTINNGTIASFACSITYNDYFVIVAYHIRVSGATGRPIINITGIPTDCPDFTYRGSPVLIRASASDIFASDASFMTKTGSSATIEIYNFLGQAASGEGFIEYNS